MFGQYDVVRQRKQATLFRDWDDAADAELACLERFRDCDVQLLRNGARAIMLQLSDVRTGEHKGFVRDVLADSPMRKVWS